MAIDLTQRALLEIVITAQNRAAAALQQASSQVGGLHLSLYAVGQSALLAGGAITHGLEAALGAVVGPGEQFQQTMSGVGAVSEATGSQMQQLSALALQLGKDTVFSANDAGSAIEELAKGGIGIQDILNGAARATVNLAAAGGVDLPQAATIAANAMNTFALSGSQMVHVSDMIAGAANASSLEVGDFAYSLQYAGSFARSVGLSFDDLAVAIAEMGRAGITGSAAGTGLADFLARLQPRAGQALKTMEQLGLVTKEGANAFFDQGGHIKSLADIQQVLQNSLAGLTDAQRAHDVQLIFGMQGQTAANVLLREGAAGYDAMAAAMSKVTAGGVASGRMNNLAGDVEQFRGSVDTLAISMETTLDSALRRIMQTVTSAVNALLDWTSAHQALLASILPVAGALAGVAAAALTVGGAAALVLAALNPVTVAMAAVGAGAVALGAAWATNWGGIRDTLSDAWSAMQPAIDAIRYSVGAIVTDFQTMPLGDALQASVGILGAAFGRFTDWMQTTALPAIERAAGQWAGALWTWAGNVWTEMSPLLGTLAGQLEGWLATGAGTIERNVRPWAVALWSWVGNVWAGMQPALRAVGDQLISWINGTTATIAKNTDAWAKALTDWIAPAAAGVPGQMTTWTDALTAWLNSDGAQAMSRLGDALARLFITAFEDALKHGVQASLNWAEGKAGSWNPLMPRISAPGIDLLPTAGNIFSGLGGFFGIGQSSAAGSPPQATTSGGPETQFSHPPGSSGAAPHVTVSLPPVGGVQERDMFALVQATTRAMQQHADTLTAAVQAAHVAFTSVPLGGASTVALAQAGGQAGIEAAQAAALQAGIQAAIQRVHEAGGPPTLPPGLGSALGSIAAAQTSTGAGGTTPSNVLLGGGGGGTVVNINVTVAADAVHVETDADTATSSGLRDMGLDVGEDIADALAAFARAGRFVLTPPRPHVVGTRR